ncbi:MAG: sigma-70 family RNA polymerase sigma factor [Planctomycetes bacterium]|nr:sigma-70 family RNA polymerase sigma factor [Planctomycetota bacterium]
MSEPPVRTLDLIRAAQGGDDRALDDLCGRYQQRVLEIVRIRMGPRLRREMDSMDLVQETFADAVRGFDRFELQDEASLIRWLRSVVENRIRDAARHHDRDKRARAREVAADAGDSPDGTTPQLADQRTRPLDGLARGERRADLERALDRLGDADRELILLRDYEGHAWAQVAELCGRASPDAARVAHREALGRLAVELARIRGGHGNTAP